ncbi:ABC transporter substrate-binding protein [Anaerosporobacter sp.]|uniref:ABC transporter substrate-binding protein n=1 Tax=Anaerosporobacter sp. TaxID=1872529 RepID=UPI00286ED99B|nr:ABC transporter substrate-binding protein [Anaerosporobacter sp.]
MRGKSKFHIALILVCFAMLFSGCGKQGEKQSKAQEKKVVIGNLAAGNVMVGDSLAIAKYQKYLEEELNTIGYAVEYVGLANGPAVNEALAANEIDFASYGDLPALVLKSNDIDAKVIATSANISNMGIVVQPDSDIKTVKDLEGKKVICTKGTVLQKYLYQIAADNDLDLDKVEIINAGADGNALFTCKEADAFVTTDFEIQLLKENKVAEILVDSRDDASYATQLLFVGRTKYMDENPEVPVAILKALTRAYEFAKSNPSEVYPALKCSAASDEVIKAIYDFDDEKFEYLNPEITAESLSKLEDLNVFLKNNGFIANDVDLEQYVDSSYYEKAK